MQTIESGGCAAYGHSCFGGHGKRSGPVIEPDCTGDNRANNVSDIFKLVYRLVSLV